MLNYWEVARIMNSSLVVVGKTGTMVQLTSWKQKLRLHWVIDLSTEHSADISLEKFSGSTNCARMSFLEWMSSYGECSISRCKWQVERRALTLLRNMLQTWRDLLNQKGMILQHGRMDYDVTNMATQHHHNILFHNSFTHYLPHRFPLLCVAWRSDVCLSVVFRCVCPSNIRYDSAARGHRVLQAIHTSDTKAQSMHVCPSKILGVVNSLTLAQLAAKQSPKACWAKNR